MLPRRGRPGQSARAPPCGIPLANPAPVRYLAVMSTPHINAQPGDFAETVLMPGDPLRAQFIAETFLTDARRVTDVRNVWGFTGTFEGRPVSVMAHGMGIPSCSIYATELVRTYGVKELIRVGSCGALAADVQLGDIIIGMGASTDSKVNRMRFRGHDFAALADFGLVERAVAAARAAKVPVRVGSLFSADLFYSPETEMFDVMEKYGILGVEMEAAGLYGVAAEEGVRALTIVTVSDHIRRGEHLSPEQRQTSFGDMMRVALKAATAT
jgi:purine-nucleoside phosphorylase